MRARAGSLHRGVPAARGVPAWPTLRPVVSPPAAASARQVDRALDAVGLACPWRLPGRPGVAADRGELAESLADDRLEAGRPVLALELVLEARDRLRDHLAAALLLRVPLGGRARDRLAAALVRALVGRV